MLSNTSSAASNIYATVASAAALVMLTASLTSLLPHDLKRSLKLNFRLLVSRFASPQLTLVIPEFDGLVANEVYESAEIYLAGKINPTTRKLRLTKPKREKSIKLRMEEDEQVNDIFEGAQFSWRMECYTVDKTIAKSMRRIDTVNRSFQLSFDIKHKEKLFASYLPHVLEKAQSIAAEKKTLKLFTLDNDAMYENLGNAWRSVYLEHPSTFDTLALDPKLKKTILDDLDGFVKRREFYKSVGKTWKRGYLLYGPPGTGKSSLIAAIANYLKFDIYDLDLTEIYQNSELRKLMVATANRSILVVEDIDCSVNLHDREQDSTEQDSTKNRQQMTLSGFLNFVDGLWSTCGDERIIIFTTNHKDKLDPALLRPGRMDMHIHLSYCTPATFKVLAYNYLKKETHPLFEDIERLIEKVNVTPAEVAEKLMKNDEHDVVIQELLDALKAKKIQQDEAKATKETEGQEGKECLEKVDI